jgi:hypothetical protein
MRFSPAIQGDPTVKASLKRGSTRWSSSEQGMQGCAATASPAPPHGRLR